MGTTATEGNAGRKATLVLLTNAAGAGLGYVSLLLIGRYFAPASYGSWLFAFSLAGFFAVLSNLGLGAAHQRHVAQGVPADRAIGVLVRLRAILGTALLAAFGLAYGLWAAVKGGDFTDATTPLVLGLALLVQVLSGTRQVLLDTWQGQQRVHRVETLRLLDTAGVVFLLGNAALLLAHLQGRWEVIPGVGALWAGILGLDGPPSLEQAAVLLASAYALAKGLTLLVAWAWAVRDRQRTGPWDRELARSYLRVALPFALIGSISLVLQYTDTVMLGYFWTAREVGLYGAAQKLSTLCLVASTAVGAVLFPRFAQLRAAGDAAGEAATFAAAERYLLLLATLPAAAMVALPTQGLHVGVGDAYLDAAMPLRLLALWALASTMAQPIASRLMGGDSMGILVRATAIDAGGNALLNALLIPRAGLGLGPTGAALATLLATLVTYGYLRAHSRRHHGIPWANAHQARILAAGLVVAAFWWGALRLAGPTAFDRFWELGAWGVAGTVVYALALAAFGELRRRDLAFLRRVARPAALVQELRGRV
jgi:O-antigen/teichoic acid export membrane protein